MARTAQAQVQDMIERASRLGDDVLAAEIRAFADSRQFGLVFEHNRPERMRLYGKPVSAGDVVQILPERGKQEDAASKLLWRVDDIPSGVGIANLVAYRSGGYSENDNEPCRERLENLVAVAEYDQPIYTGLRETGRVECGGDKPYQVVINGENYYALESLLFCYAGKVDCVYIDPPYNTGAKDWKYNNDYVDGNDAYRHSKWLAMMERRLKLARQLLNPENGVLIVTIDEKEYLRLGLLLEQTFPDARIQMVSSVINPSGSSRDGKFSRVDEYLFFVFVGHSKVNPWQSDMLRPDKTNKTRQVRWVGLMRNGEGSSRARIPSLFYPIFIDEKTGAFHSIGQPLPPTQDRSTVAIPPGTVALFPVDGNGRELQWRLYPPSFMEYLSNGWIKFGKRSDDGTRSVSYLQKGMLEKIRKGDISIIGKTLEGSLVLAYKDSMGTKKPATVWNMVSHSASEHGSSFIKAMLPGRKFTYPKSLYAVEDTLRFVIADKPDALVLDFFAGSGTTAHAVMRLNRQDGGHRRCILVTNNEVSADEEKTLIEQGYRHGDPEWERLGICEYVTKPRVKAAITGRTPEGEPIKGDYKFTDEFPMAEGFEENAVFYELTYQNETRVELDQAFEAIAPLLWMKAGSRGRCITERKPDFDIADTYAILFDYRHVREFVSAVRSTPEFACVFIVTDDAGRFASVKEELGDIECVRLYESYLRSFKIAAEDAVR